MKNTILQLIEMKHHYLKYYDADPESYSEYKDYAETINDILDDIEKLLLKSRTDEQEIKRLRMMLRASEILREREVRHG